MRISEVVNLYFVRPSAPLTAEARYVFAARCSQEFNYEGKEYKGLLRSDPVFDTEVLQETGELALAARMDLIPKNVLAGDVHLERCLELCELFFINTDEGSKFKVPFENLNTLDELLAQLWVLHKLYGGPHHDT